MIKVQQIKPCCASCDCYNTSTSEKKMGWCSHAELPGGTRHFPESCALAGVQPDCPLIDGLYWRPQIKLRIAQPTPTT